MMPTNDRKAPERANIALDRAIRDLALARLAELREAGQPVPTLISLIESWIRSSPDYRQLAQRLNAG